MIITVTMNPAIDKTVEVDKFQPYALNRIRRVEYDAGGKGINVSKTIHALGGESLAMGFLGGNTGMTIENVLNAWNIRHDFIYVDGDTRTNTKIFDCVGGVTELNEPGPAITGKQIEALIQKICAYTDKETLVVLAGSVPGGVRKTIYAEITECVHKKGGKVLLDADGEVFRLALKAVPDIIKPNWSELEEYTGTDHALTVHEIIETAENFHEKGIQTVAVSMGKDGAVFAGENYKINCPALPVKAHSTVGAGDAMVAALAYAHDRKLSEKEMVRLCMAVSAGAVTTVGTKPPDRALVEQLMSEVRMQML